MIDELKQHLLKSGVEYMELEYKLAEPRIKLKKDLWKILEEALKRHDQTKSI